MGAPNNEVHTSFDVEAKWNSSSAWESRSSHRTKPAAIRAARRHSLGWYLIRVVERTERLVDVFTPSAKPPAADRAADR